MSEDKKYIEQEVATGARTATTPPMISAKRHTRDRASRASSLSSHG